MGETAYKPDECAYCGAKTWCEYPRPRLEPQCRACKVERFFERVLYPPLGYKLYNWTRKVLRDLYGTTEQDTGLRRYRRAYISVAKQNGKSFLIGGLPVYHLTMEDEPSAEAFGAAAAREQAGIVFKSAETLINANPALQRRLRIIPSTKHIFQRNGNGVYQVVSAEGKVQDGKRPSLLIRDEVHRWTTARSETLRDVLTKGQISRREPLDIQITTAGAQYECPLWWNEYQFAKRVLAEPTLAPDYYVAIWEADFKRIEEDPEYWKSKEARLAANPSHEDHGGHLTDKAICAEMAKAVENPAERPKYLRYHLNVPLTTDEEPIINMHQWQECGGGVDLRTWPEYDVELLIRKWGLLEKPCYAGVDASWTTDMTALALVFPPFDARELWHILGFTWLPKARVAEIERRVRVPLKSWAQRKFLELTDGNAIDLREVKRKIAWAREMFDLREIDYDRANFRVEALELQDQGYSIMEIRQGYETLGRPTKKVLGLYPDKKIVHGNNPVLNWHAGCLRLQYDHKDNCQPSKPERGSSAARIDLIAAIVDAFAGALANITPVNLYADSATCII